MEMAQASFMSIGGYHHHLAVNTWGRRDRPASHADDVIALLHYEIVLPDSSALDRVAAGLAQEAPHDGVLEVDDPTGITVRFTTT
jgi:catechol 2,3-dioxygenase